ncbi:RagB/SusD family nutrient uptake outer membrane protein [Cyclobacterium salsum]|uniref:RagB/SusD family nutrient uptake outer membrane protein n=1 Tax=Cyclobacterium salsum TaxID=2666329 RepID=UPI001390D383|nr:RagB/SusD family nutrient uptake outer membrane protein [Cyclobacterium salsum]
MKNISKLLFIGLLSFGCTDLSEEILDTAVGTGVLEAPEAPDLVMAPVYARLNSTYGQHNWLFNLQSIASDESIVPFRGGTDWFDGGIFIEMHQHSWTPFHSTVRDVWSHLTQGVARAAGARQTLEEINGPDRYLAEARAMGAFYNLHLLDLYGVSFEKLPEDVGTPQLSRVLRGADAIDFILTELDAAEPALGSRAEVGSVRFSKAAAWGIKARLLLNKAVYSDRYASTFTFDESDMTEVISLTSQIIDSGDYALEMEDYFSIWNVDNHDHPEHVFAFDQRLATGGSNRLAWFGSSRSRHGSLTNILAVGSDGVSLTTDFFNKWEGNHEDPRFFQRNLPDGGSIPESDFRWNRGIQFGQQYGIVLDESNRFKRTPDGELVIEKLVNRTRTGEDVVYTIEVDLGDNRGHSNGPRAFKIDFDPEAQTGQCCSRVNLPILRMGDVYLMRAEGQFRNGNPVAALADLNALRTARGAELLSEVDLDIIHRERTFELYTEMLARTDAIRFGKWENAWIDKSSSNPIRRLYPIPQGVIDAASGSPGFLEQNEGY